MSSSTTRSNSDEAGEALDPYLEAHPVANPGEWSRQRFEHELAIHARYAAQEHSHRANLHRRVTKHWPEDRIKETLKVAARIRREPAYIAAKLRCSHYGTLWLRDQWKLVLDRFDQVQGPLTKADFSHALDLLGQPKHFRRIPFSKIDPPQEMTDPTAIHDFTRSVIEAEIAQLNEKLVLTAELDKSDHESAMNGFFFYEDKELNRLSRLQTASAKAIQRLWTTRQAYENIHGRPAAPPKVTAVPSAQLAAKLQAAPMVDPASKSTESTVNSPARKFFNPRQIWANTSRGSAETDEIETVSITLNTGLDLVQRS